MRGVLWLCLTSMVGMAGAEERGSSELKELQTAAGWVRAEPESYTQYDYVMTGKIRILLFWTGKDDVGGGYIRMAAEPGKNGRDRIQVLFGSDPAKAPRGLNRWGAAIEIVQNGRAPDSTMGQSAFLGFMNLSGKGVTTKKRSSSTVAEGEHQFEADLSWVGRDEAIAVTLPFHTREDLTLKQFAEVEQRALAHLGSGRAEPRVLRGKARRVCNRVSGFLFTIRQMVHDGLSGRKAPWSVCYLFDNRTYTATLQSLEPLGQTKVSFSTSEDGGVVKRYSGLVRTQFRILNHESGEKSDFELLVGSQGSLRGVPVQIAYQPKWWMKVILNLRSTPAEE